MGRLDHEAPWERCKMCVMLCLRTEAGDFKSRTGPDLTRGRPLIQDKGTSGLEGGSRQPPKVPPSLCPSPALPSADTHTILCSSEDCSHCRQNTQFAVSMPIVAPLIWQHMIEGTCSLFVVSAGE